MININLFTTNWHATGTNVSVPQYSMEVRVLWIDSEGVEHEGTRTVLFPNVLNNLPPAHVKEKIEEMLIDYAIQELEAR